MSANDCLSLLIRPDWWQDAACLGMGVNNFFIDQLDPDYKEKIEVAKRVCRSCKVKDQCFEYAKGNKEEFGVWAEQSVEDEDFTW